MTSDEDEVLREQWSPQRRTDLLLRQYEIVAEDFRAARDRRESAGRFYVAVNAALVSLGAVAWKQLDESTVLFPVSIAGLLVCFAWVMYLEVVRSSLRRQHRQLRELEIDLPRQPFSHSPARGRLARWSGRIRLLVPTAFAVLFLIGCAVGLAGR